MNKISAVLANIKQYQSFLVTAHIHPDPDSLCSELAIARYLTSLGKKVVIVNDEPVPERYHFIDGAKQIKSFAKKLKVQAEAVIVVDCGELARVGKVQQLLPDGAAVINIDHHVTNDQFGSVNLVMPAASSTCEIIYDLLSHAKYKMDRRMANYLYMGIMTDTGSFRYENTTARTHRIVSDLMSHGISVNKHYQRLYERIPLADMRSFAKILSEFKVFLKGRVVVVILKRSVYRKFSEDFDLKDAILKLLRAIHGVDVFVILTEVSARKTRVNFRSSSKVDVAAVARHFKGGGHKRASGCVIDDSLKRAQQVVLKVIAKVLK